MRKATIWAIVLLAYTGISVGKLGKALLTPFHLYMGLLIGYGLLVSRKERNYVHVSLLVLMLWVLVVNILQFPNIRYTSILYTFIYALEITILYNLMRRVDMDTILYSLKFILYSYCINLFLGFAFDTVGFRNPAILEIIRVHYAEGESHGRPMGFSTEPSYAAFILSASFLSYCHLRDHKWDRETMMLAGAYFMSIIFSKSAYGFIFVAVNLMDWALYIYGKGSKGLRGLFPLIAIVGSVGLGVVMANSENEVAQRLTKVSKVMFDPTVDSQKRMKKLQEADGSAFARIGPTYLLLTSDDSENLNLMMGAGAGAAGEFMAEFLAGIAVDEGTEKLDAGIIPAFIFDYGLIGFVLLWIFLINCFSGLPAPFWIMFFLIMPNANVNTQLLWFGISCFLFTSIAKSTEKRRAQAGSPSLDPPPAPTPTYLSTP
ncbi:MAG: hypothetical protein D6765_09280 [Bacteroidetes bacterium]|nr:MAG: hypothetical protein D6765_09280 [Bacteroidota bacterium]